MRRFYCMAIVQRELGHVGTEQLICERVTAFGREFVAQTPVCARHQMENWMKDKCYHYFEVVVSGISVNLNKKRGKKHEIQSL